MEPIHTVLTVYSAHNLIKRYLFKNPNPFVCVKFDHTCKKSKCIQKSVNPEWNETFEIDFNSIVTVVEISVWDNRLYSSKKKSSFLGRISFNLAIIDSGIKTLKLLRHESISEKSVKGTITFELRKLINFPTIPDATTIPNVSITNGYECNIKANSHSVVNIERTNCTQETSASNNNNKNDESCILALPRGYEKRITTDGKLYYVDIYRGAMHWYHPGIPKFLRKITQYSCLGPLPQGWDTLSSNAGRPYFIDHANRTTQYSDPRLLRALALPNGLQDTIVKLRAAGIKVKDYNGCSNKFNRHSRVLGSDNNNTATSTTTTTTTATITELSGIRITTIQSSPLVISETSNSSLIEPRSESTSHLFSENRSSESTDHSSADVNSSGIFYLPYDNINTDDVECQVELAPLSFKRQRISRPTSDYVIKNKQAIEVKLKHLRGSLKDLAQRKLVIIETTRDDILDQSYKAVRQLRATELRRRLVIKFADEEGLDYGGVAREWLYLLSETLFSCRHGLFEPSGGMKQDGNLLRVSSLSNVNDNHLRYFNFIGRIIGIAIFHGYYIDADFCRTFYRRLLDKKPCLDDFKYYDMSIYTSLKWILENKIDDAELNLYFSVEEEVFGEIQIIDLCPNGRNILVTDASKQRYIDQYINYHLGTKCANQYEHIRRGIYEVLPTKSLELLNEYEIEVLLTGISQIDIDDWQRHTRLKHCSENEELIKWFWQVIRNYSESQRVKLLQFVTGSSRIPLLGFEGLRGSYGSEEPKLFTIKVIRSANPISLPKAHTCFNRLDLPPYTSYLNLYEKLTCAIEETCGFAVS